MLRENKDSTLFKHANDAYTNNILERHSIQKSYYLYIWMSFQLLNLKSHISKNVACNVTLIPTGKQKRIYLAQTQKIHFLILN